MPFSRKARSFLVMFSLIFVLVGAGFSPLGSYLFNASVRLEWLTHLDEKAIQLGSLHQPTVKFMAHHLFLSYPEVEAP